MFGVNQMNHILIEQTLLSATVAEMLRDQRALLLVFFITIVESANTLRGYLFWW